jgi:arginine decarboxylase
MSPEDIKTLNSKESAKTHFSDWSSGDSEILYGVRGWGVGYFNISQEGLAEVNAYFGDKKVSVTIMDIIQGMKDRGMEMPAILRIENLLDHRIKALNEAFAKAIESLNYQGAYRGVFPIKVNQQCHVIEEISDFGGRFHHGLEAGSKAELIIALSMLKDKESLIVCNGYKDAEFVELGLYATKMGFKVFFVVETLTEIPTIIECSNRLGIRPLVGVRVKLAATVDGHWNEKSGDRSIFGLSTSDLLDVIDELKGADMLDCLQLLHCHIGSQIPNIRNIRAGVLEACRYYTGLINEDAPMGYIDLGGGLAVDYDGARTNSIHSMNYRLDEYCVDIVETLISGLNQSDIPHPVIITESGRATVAYSSMLLFNILDVRDHRPDALPDSLPEGSPIELSNLWDTMLAIRTPNLQECYNDAIFYRDEMRALFRRGQVSLRELALADNIYLTIMERISERLGSLDREIPELEDLPERLADTYYGNFSLFQSLPDIWAIDQRFPVMPVHRLNERPSRNAILADTTCDCDGKISSFATCDGTSGTLPLHELRKDENYYLAVFLVGAYQETLGDLHNLFGDTNVVSVRINEDGSFEFVREFAGDSIGDVLSYVEYDPRVLTEKFRQLAEEAVKDGTIDVGMRQQAMKAFTESLQGYTYFEH